jgi:hypothetical protein
VRPEPDHHESVWEIASSGGSRGRTTSRRPTAERRREPRVPVGVPASIGYGPVRSDGSVIEASACGLLAEVLEPPLFVASAVTVWLALPQIGLYEVRGTVVRGALGPEGRVRLGIRMAQPLTPLVTRSSGGELPMRRVASGRPRAVVAAELCALGTGAFELVVLDPSGPVPDVFVEWLDRLAGELGATPPPAPSTARDLIDAIAAIAAPA